MAGELSAILKMGQVKNHAERAQSQRRTTGEPTDRQADRGVSAVGAGGNEEGGWRVRETFLEIKCAW